MKIFVLEDSLERIKLFRDALSSHQVTYCDDATLAKELLFKDKYDAIFFDHDLGGKVFVSSKKENTGYQVAKFCKKNNIRFEWIFIHSMNPIGAMNIETEVSGLSDNIIRKPFGNWIKELH